MNAIPKKTPEAKETPSSGSQVAKAVLHQGNRTEAVTDLLSDLLIKLRHQVSEEFERGRAQKDNDTAIDCAVVEAFCNKMEFLLETIEGAWERQREWLLEKGARDA
jgi:hypothetical protein